MTPLTDLREFDRASRWRKLGVLAEVRPIPKPSTDLEPPSQEEAIYAVLFALAVGIAVWVAYFGAWLP